MRSTPHGADRRGFQHDFKPSRGQCDSSSWTPSVLPACLPACHLGTPQAISPISSHHSRTPLQALSSVRTLSTSRRRSMMWPSRSSKPSSSAWAATRASSMRWGCSSHAPCQLASQRAGPRAPVLPYPQLAFPQTPAAPFSPILQPFDINSEENPSFIAWNKYPGASHSAVLGCSSPRPQPARSLVSAQAPFRAEKEHALCDFAPGLTPEEIEANRGGTGKVPPRLHAHADM